MSLFLMVILGLGQGEPPEVAFYKAWYALEVEREPGEARTLFKSLLERNDLEPAMRELCRERLDECRRLLSGSTDEVTQARARFESVDYRVFDGQYLDLDTGGVFDRAEPRAGVRCEVQGPNPIGPATLDESFAVRMASPQGVAWSRLETDKGRTAWVSVNDRNREP